MSKSNVNPNHYKVAGRERQGEDIAQARNRQQHAQSLVRRRSEGEAGLPVPAPMGDSRSSGTAQTRAAKKATSKTSADSEHPGKTVTRAVTQKGVSPHLGVGRARSTGRIAPALGKEPSHPRRNKRSARRP
jgi:hypothetical protein